MRGRWVLTATILASSMRLIDGTVVNVALPFLQTSLNATAIVMIGKSRRIDAREQ